MRKGQVAKRMGGDGSKTDCNGAYYQGHFKLGKADGYGTKAWPDGNKFSG